MAVSALTRDSLLFTTDTSPVANNTNTTSTEAAFSLPADTSTQPTITEQHEEPSQDTPDNQHAVVSDDSSNEMADSGTDLSATTPALANDQLLSQQLTPLQLTLGQPLSDSSTDMQTLDLPALPTPDDSLPQTDAETNATATTTAIPLFVSDETTRALLQNGAGKLNASGKNTTEHAAENTSSTIANNDATPSLNISVLTLPTIKPAITESNTSTLASQATADYNRSSTNLFTPSANAAITSSSTMSIESDNSLRIISGLTATTRTTTITSDNTNNATNQSGMAPLSNLSLFAENNPSLFAMQNTQTAASSTAPTTQQLGEQLLDTLKQQVATQLTQKTQQATIRLDPPSLGQLDIAIRIDGDKMTVQINAEHSGVRESLQNSREQLRQLLSTEHSGSINVDIGQQQSSTPQQRQPSYVLAADPDIISAAVTTSDTTTTSASSEPAITGDWLNTVV